MLKKTFIVIVVLTFGFSLCAAADWLKLPAPQLDGGKNLMRVFKDRKSDRAFSPKKLPVNVLSNMLWPPAE